jgi:hypothetical protein
VVQCRFFLQNADAVADEDSAGVGLTITAPNPLVVQQQHTPGQAMDEGDPTAPASQSAAATLIAKRGES